MTSISLEAAVRAVVENELQTLDQLTQDCDHTIVELEKKIKSVLQQKDELIFRRGSLSRFVTGLSREKCSFLLEKMGIEAVALEGATTSDIPPVLSQVG